MSRPTLSDVTAAPARYVDAHVHFWDQSEPDIDWPMLEPNFRFPLHQFNDSGHYNAVRQAKVHRLYANLTACAATV